jgi:hypothetical protein
MTLRTRALALAASGALAVGGLLGATTLAATAGSAAAATVPACGNSDW